MKKKRPLKKNTIVLLVLSAILLCGSAVGSTRAALTYYSENYVAGINTYDIDVSILENGVAVDYLLDNWMDEEKTITLGKYYDERISVENTGTIDSYVRVIITKSWRNADDSKDTSLSPDLIELNLVTGNGWVVDEEATTAERIVLYYTEILPVGAVTPILSDTFRVNPAIGTKVIETVEEGENGKTITFKYEYDGYIAYLEAETDSVQTHNAADAIKSAWGIDVDVAEDGSISLR